MVISELGNALPQLGHNTAQIISPEARKDNYKRKILSWIGTCPGQLGGRASTHKAGDPG